MKPLSEQLLDLSTKAKQTEDVIAAAQERNRTRLESQRNELNQSIADGKARANAAQDHVHERWNAARKAVEQRFTDLRGDADARRAARGAKKAERRAEDAEQDAADAIDFAIYVLDEAEYAVVDAVLARADADEFAMQS